jgi:peptidoglycan/LPS O-acetylase OafA/YrhL
MNTEAINTGSTKRIFWIDNLRTFMIFLVVLLHAGIVYESSGIGAYISWIVLDPATNDLSGILSFIILDIFVIATLFFVAGYLTPRAVENKQGWAFLKSRFIRLILPWFVAVITMIPLYNVIFLSSRNLPQADWTTYFHFTGNSLTGMNWLWFLPVLFFFNIVYFLLAKINIKVNISFKLAVLITSLIAIVYGVGMVIFGLTGWTKTAIVDFQNERLLIYFLVFLLGALAFRRRTLDEKPTSKKLYLFTAITAWIPITAYLIFRLAPLLNPGNFIVSAGIDLLLYWLSFSLSLICLIYLMVETFRRYVDKTGRVWSELNKNSYGVFIIHVIVMGVIAMLLLNFTMPSLLKYLTLTVLTYLVSNLLISLYRSAVSWVRKREFGEKRESKT